MSRINKKITDLSYNIEHQMAVFPTDPPVGILTHHHYKNGYFVSQLIMGTHSGTHVDAPVHKLSGRESITDLPLGRYIGWRTAILDFTGRSTDIGREDCEKYDADLTGCDGVIFKTGWGKHFGKECFFENYPGLKEDVAGYLEEKGIRLIGLETPSVHPEKHQEIHTELLKRGICIAESLANVSLLEGKYTEFHAVPLKLKDLDGSPVRAYAVEI